MYLQEKGQTIYARGQGLINGQRYAVYREGEPYYFTDNKGKKHSLGIDYYRLLQVLRYLLKKILLH